MACTPWEAQRHHGTMVKQHSGDRPETVRNALRVVVDDEWSVVAPPLFVRRRTIDNDRGSE